MVAIDRKGYTAGEQITKRLNALGATSAASGCCGISSWFLVTLMLTGGAWAISAMQTLVFTYLLHAIQLDFPMDTSAKAIVNGSVMIGAFVGSFVFGNLADLYGRKQMLLVSFTLGTVGSALCAVAPSRVFLSLFRFVAGIGLGGEQPIMGALILELAPETVRGRMLVYMDAFWALGAILALVLAHEAEPVIGWRHVLTMNAALLPYATLIHLYIPESPKWLATVGRPEDAVRVLRAIERACSIYLDEDVDDAILHGAAPPRVPRQITVELASQSTSSRSSGVSSAAPPAPAPARASRMIAPSHEPSFCQLLVDRFRVLFRYPYVGRTMVLWAVCTGLSLAYYGVDIYLLDRLAPLEGSIHSSLVIYGTAAAQIPGYVLAAALVERLGRRSTLMLFVLGACVGCLLEAYVVPTTPALLVAGCIRSCFFMGAWGALYAYVPEHYPIHIRVMGAAYAWGISRIGAFLGPYLVLWMAEQWGFSTPAVVWSLCAVLALVIVVLALFGVETAGQQIDEQRTKSYDASSDGRASSFDRDSLPNYSILEEAPPHQHRASSFLRR